MYYPKQRIPNPFGASNLETVLQRHITLPTSPDDRYFNDDLPDLGDSELLLEHSRCRAAILFASHPQPWIVERLQRIEAEMGVRRGR